MKLLLITGGLGFLGSNFIRWQRTHDPGIKIINVDCHTYAAGMDNLGSIRSAAGYTEFGIDITNTRHLRGLWPKEPVTVVHFAAETHVDRSLLNALPFAETNILGTLSVLEVARNSAVERLIIVSTDEVYGPTPSPQKYTETQAMNPTSPYAASKGSGDLLALTYQRTYDVPVTILRSVNVYGPRQHPEKFIPLFITQALAGEPLPLYGDGKQQREWLWVEDFCKAVGLLVQARAPAHTVYHVAAGDHLCNLDVAQAIIELTGCPNDLLRLVADRPGHDRRYALDDTRFREEFGWQPQTHWEDGIKKTVDWYNKNRKWIKRRLHRSFHEYYQRQYQWRLDG